MSKRKRNFLWRWILGLGVVSVVSIGIFFATRTQNLVNEVTTDIPSIEKKVLVLNFDPILENYGGVRLHEYFHWNDPVMLEQEYVDTVKEVSHGYVNYRVVERQNIDGFPTKNGPYQFTDEAFVNCRKNPNTCNNDMISYQQVIANYQVCEKLNAGQIDELWLWGGPHFGYYESVMAGTGAFWTNGPVITGTNCNSQLNIMGFNYERTNSEMIEDLGHRMEGVMNKVFRTTIPTNKSNPWTRYIAYNKVDQNNSGCGTVHYPPNGTKDYDWSNLTPVTSYCIDWEHEFPLLEGDNEVVTCANWGCTGLGYKKWWLSHLPHGEGRTNGKLNNWWKYLVDYEYAIKTGEEKNNYVAVNNGLGDSNVAPCKLISNNNEVYFGLNSSNITGCADTKPLMGTFDFTQVNIKRGDQVNNVYVSFVQDGPYNNELVLSLRLTSGIIKSSLVNWHIKDHWEYKNRVSTPDLTAQLNEIIHSPYWKSGGVVRLEVNYVSGEGHRRVFAFERLGITTSAILVYELGTTPTLSPSLVPSIVPSPSSSPSPTASTSPMTGPGDYNGDGCVTLKDYQFVIANWGRPYTNADLQLIKTNFGKCY